MVEVTHTFLDELRRMPCETEWLEFKRAGHSFSFDQMAQYWKANPWCDLGAGCANDSQ